MRPPPRTTSTGASVKSRRSSVTRIIVTTSPARRATMPAAISSWSASAKTVGASSITWRSLIAPWWTASVSWLGVSRPKYLGTACSRVVFGPRPSSPPAAAQPRLWPARAARRAPRASRRGRGGAASSAARGRARAAPRRRERARDRSSSCRRRSPGRRASSCGHLARRELRQVLSALGEEALGQLLDLRDLADQRMREQRLVDEVAVAGGRRLDGEPLVRGDVLDEAEQLRRDRALVDRRGAVGFDPGRHFDHIVVGKAF